MPEVVRPLDGVPVMLRPCPPWCTEGRHFADGEAIYADHGYDHSRTQPNETATASAAEADRTDPAERSEVSGRRWRRS